MAERSILESALRLAGIGILVFHCRPKDETFGGKLRRAKSPIAIHGHKDATTDETQIEKWWRKRPDALIGVPTGPQNGLFVIDVDPEGLDWYKHNKKQLGSPRVHRTPRGGYHLVYKYPDNSGLTVGVSEIAKGVDHRGDGGYIVWWPAHGYEIENKVGVSKLDDLPDWLLEKLRASRRARKEKRSNATGNAEGGSRFEEGSRNSSLARLAGRMRREGADVRDIEAALLAFNQKHCDPPLDDGEVATIARSIARYEPEPEDRRHDWGNAQRLWRQAENDVRYEPIQRVFYVWDGPRWCMDDGAHRVQRLAVDSARALLEEALNCADTQRRKQTLDWFRTSLNEGRIKGAVELLKNVTECHIRAAQLDPDPFLLGVPNGTVNLSTGKLRVPDRRDMITRIAGCEFDPEAECPRWLRFLDEITDRNQELIDYLQALVGYTLSGDTSGQMLMFLYGTGQNGKSVFIEVIRDLMGEYGMSLRTEALSLKAFSSKNGPSEDIARLIGARMVTVNETAEGMRFDESLVKDLTGEDTVAARRMYQGTVEYRPAFKIWIRGNHQPEFNGADGGMARRVRLIPFEVRIDDDRVDPQLRQKLKAELPGILNWAIEGCTNWLCLGKIETPQKVLDATAEYVEAMDGLADFIEAKLDKDKSSHIPTSEIFERYRTWCEDAGIRMPMTKHKLALRLKARGLKSVVFRVNGKQVRGFLGVRVKAASERFNKQTDGVL